MKLDFNSLPKYNNLFRDFINQNNNILDFFPSNKISFSDIFNKRITETKEYRTLLRTSIIESMQSINLNHFQLENLSLIENQNCLFVITGQQPALFGGPLYSLYKAMSAISLSSRFKVQYPNFDFIPLFWVEDNDDDIDEVNFLNYFDNNVKANKFLLEIQNKQQFSQININNSIPKIFQNLSESLFIPKDILNTETTQKLLPDHFMESLNYLMNEYGLMFIKASEVTQKTIFKEIIKSDILEPNSNQKIIENTNKSLIERGYDIQAKSSDINFFYIDQFKRIKISFIDNTYNIGSKAYTVEEMANLIESESYNFVPKVLFRPVIQDILIPSAAYVGGPGEISYMAQLKDIYSKYNLTMPIIYPRHSITIVNSMIKRTLEKEKFDLLDLYKPYHILEKEISDNMLNDETETKFIKMQSEIVNSYNEILMNVRDIDASLESSWSMSKNKSIELLDNLRKKTISQLKKQNENKLTRINKANTYIYPNNNLQEREFNIFNFVNNDNIKNIINQLNIISHEQPNEHFILEI